MSNRIFKWGTMAVLVVALLAHSWALTRAVDEKAAQLSRCINLLHEFYDDPTVVSDCSEEHADGRSLGYKDGLEEACSNAWSRGYKEGTRDFLQAHKEGQP